MGTYIPFPNIPQYPGVPQLMRPISTAIAENPIVAIGLGTAENLLISALQQPSQWGIFDAIDGSQLGINSNSNSILQAIGGTLLSQLTGTVPTTLTVEEFGYMREGRISDFPIELGSFASYNKVQMPANPVVSLILQGSANDRTTLLDALESAAASTDLYNVVTPEYVYTNYSVERFTYRRTASQGATLLVVEVSLKEIRPITASFSTAATPINNPINSAATPQENNGSSQAATPSASTALQLSNSAKSFWTTNISPMFNGGGN